MKWISVIGITVMTVSIFFLSFSNQLFFLLSIFILSGIGIGVWLPCLDALITEGIDKDERGTVSSLYSSMRFVGVAAGPPVIALLMKNSYLMFYILAALGALSVLICMIGIKPENDLKRNKV